MSTIALTLPTSGSTLNNLADPQLVTALTTIQNAINGGIDAVNLGAALQASVGANSGAQISKGVSVIATTETRTNVAYGTLTTPDQVTGIVLPSNGLIAVWYQATWQESIANQARAAIFLGGNQLQAPYVSGGVNMLPGVQAARLNSGTVNKDGLLVSGVTGLSGLPAGSGTYLGDATTGQIVGIGTGAPSPGYQEINNAGSASAATDGGPIYIFAAAGTYTVSVQFKSLSGSVTAKNRKLWVQALSFA